MSDEDKKERVSLLHECEAHVIVKGEDGVPREYKPAEGKPVPPGQPLVFFDRVEGKPDQLEMRTVSIGPAKVSSPKYRKGWDSIFGKKKPKKAVN